MVFIVLNHLSGHGGALENAVGVNRYIAYLYQCGGKFGVSVFVLISAWFSIRNGTKASSVFRTIFMAFLVHFGLTVAFVIKNHEQVKVILAAAFKAFLPVYNSAFWFVTVYIILMFLSPYLNKLIYSMGKQEYSFLIVFLGFYLCFSETFGAESNRFIFCELVWFVFLYLTVGFFVLFPQKITEKKSIMLSFFLLSYALMFALFLKTGNSRYRDSGSILVLFSALSFFFFFKNLHIRQNKIINTVSSVSFMVYLIHDNQYSHIWWNNCFRCSSWWNSEFFLLFSLGIVIFFFILGFFADFVCRKIVHCIEKTETVKKLIALTDKYCFSAMNNRKYSTEK